MSSSDCTKVAGVVHSALPPQMVLCPYCGVRRSPISLPVKSGPKPTATSTASSSSLPSASLNATAKNKGKAPVFVIDSDSETIPDDTGKPTDSQITKPFSNKTFKRNKKVVEDSRREGFVRRDEKKKSKGRYELGAKKVATMVSDNRAVDIHIGPVKGKTSEFVFLGKISQFIHTVYTAYLKISAFRCDISPFSRYHCSAWKYGSLYSQSDPCALSRLARLSFGEPYLRRIGDETVSRYLHKPW